MCHGERVAEDEHSCQELIYCKIKAHEDPARKRQKWAADFGKSANSSLLTNQVPGFQWNNRLTTMSCTATTTATSTSHPYKSRQQSVVSPTATSTIDGQHKSTMVCGAQKYARPMIGVCTLQSSTRLIQQACLIVVSFQTCRFKWSISVSELIERKNIWKYTARTYIHCTLFTLTDLGVCLPFCSNKQVRFGDLVP